MAAILYYQYSDIMCTKSMVVETVSPESVHTDAVFGALSVGIGFSQSEELWTSMKSHFISYPTYKKYEAACGNLLKSTETESVLEAIHEEKRIALENSSVTDSGTPRISVIVDGGWCKRSYGHGYDANSGVGVVIGVL